MYMLVLPLCAHDRNFYIWQVSLGFRIMEATRMKLDGMLTRKEVEKRKNPTPSF